LTVGQESYGIIAAA